MGGGARMGQSLPTAVMPVDVTPLAPLAAEVEDTLYDWRGLRVGDEDVLVLWAFQVTDGGVAANILSGLKRGAFDRPDFGTGVPGVVLASADSKSYSPK